MVILNRQQRRNLERQIKKIDHRALAELERKYFMEGVRAALSVAEDSLKLKFGFGDKRLQRFREGIEKSLVESE